MKPAELGALVSSGVPIDQALKELGIEALEDELLLLAIEVGAPLLPTLELLQQQQLHDERAQTELAQAQAIPQATRRLLLWLPVGTLVISQLAGLETLQGLLEPLGALAMLAATGLLFLGARITGKMLARFQAQPNQQINHLIALRICLSAGMGYGQVDQRLGLTGISKQLIAMSQRTGAALSNLIAAEISSLQEKSISQQLTEAKKLSVALLIPLSATTLPAFLLVTIVPMVIGIAK